MHDRLVEAHARLSFLKIYLPENSTIEEKYILEFHDILHLLEQASGCDLGAYRIPATDVILQSEGNGNGAGVGSVASNGHGNGNGSEARAQPNGDGGAAISNTGTNNGNGHASQKWCAVQPACSRAALMQRIDGVLTFYGVQASPHRTLNRLPG